MTDWELPEGYWVWDVSHFPRPATGFLRALLSRTFGTAAARRWGLASDGAAFATCRGWTFVRDAWVADDEARSRRSAARETVERRRWRNEASEWRTVRRAAVEAELLALQDEPLEEYDDAALADHVGRLFETTVRLWDLHMELHLTDMVPLGALLVEGGRAGVSTGEVLALMEQASPASRPSARLVDLAAAVREAGGEPSTFDDIERMGPRAATALREFLRYEGWRPVSVCDVDSLTLGESPESVVQLILRVPERDPGPPPDPGPIRLAIAADRRAEFDELLADALDTYGIRDDNTSITGMWPVGLMRRAALHAGRRLFDSGRLDDPAHIMDAGPDEVADMLSGGGPGRDELAERARLRAEQADVTPPQFIGEGGPPEDLSDDQRWLHGALDAYGVLYEAPPDQPELHGFGIGRRPHTGRAVVAHTPEDALMRIQPGDVLVVRATAPAYDAAIAMAGALAVETGGALSHAALAAREMGIPAVIGAAGLLARITDGQTITVDPDAGRVRDH